MAIPARSRRPAPEVTDAGPLGPAEAAQRFALALAAEHHLPETSWVCEPDRLIGRPYLLARPVTALHEWLKMLPTPATVTVREPIGGYGTELVWRGRLAGHPVELVAVTYRDMTPDDLERVVAEEARGLGQPCDPERAGAAVPIESDDALTIPTPAEVRAGIWT